MTPAERLRKNQRMLDKAIRELDQVRVKLEKQEKTLVGQIKQSAQKGQMGAAKIQAKDLVRTRRYVLISEKRAMSEETTTTTTSDKGRQLHGWPADTKLSAFQIHREILRDEESTTEDLPSLTGRLRVTCCHYGSLGPGRDETDLIWGLP